MTVDTDTVVSQKEDVLTVPNSAVTYSADSRTVTVVINGKTEVREVKLGIIGSEQTEIVSGINEGDTILVPKVSKI